MYYNRQITLSDFGKNAQSKLKDSRVFEAGAGRLGCAALLYLAGAGVGNITIADADVVQLNNLHRQILYIIKDISTKKMIDELSAIELKHKMDGTTGNFFLLDVREPIEFDQYNIGGTLIPLGKLTERLHEIPTDKDILVVCKSGIRSMRAAQFIAESHTTKQVFNLKGGLMEWFANHK